MNTEILKTKIKEKVILDKEHQKIISSLHNNIEKLEKELFELKNLESHHKNINGKQHEVIDKLNKDNEQLKKENQVIREGNDYLGVFSKDLINKFKKLSDDMTANIKEATPVAKLHNKNVLFMKSVQALIRFNTELEQILKNFTKN
jgi:hypothetical protein